MFKMILATKQDQNMLKNNVLSYTKTIIVNIMTGISE